MKRKLREKVWLDDCCRKVHDGGLTDSLEVDLTWSDAVSSARLRSEHRVDLGAYPVRIGLPEDGLHRRFGAQSEIVSQHIW